MGFKADSSFLRFLTMGAAGVHRTMAQLEQRGFAPIELERYCGSNKIWATKVKRLRLPDLLCVRTGLRLEVRAKSKLEIKMSDAPANPDRVWDAGLRDDDLIAFITTFEGPDGPAPADEAEFFTVRSLRDSVEMSKVGPPKSASEGAERDRNWPATVPKRSGRVISTNAQKIFTQMDADEERDTRKQTYTLRGKTHYVKAGDRFRAFTDIIAGAPAGKADLGAYLKQDYRPLEHTRAANDVDRYAAVKALRHRDEFGPQAVAALEAMMAEETDERVKLEAAGSAAFLGSAQGQDIVAGFIWDNDDRADLRMEAVLVLTELEGSAFSREALVNVAVDERFQNDEIRQAAVWGLGKKGLRKYEDLIPFISDKEENVALHAIGAFGSDTPRAVIDQLLAELRGDDTARAAAASEALRIIDNDNVYTALIAAAKENGREWTVATLGRLSAERLRQMLAGDPLLDRIAPMLLLTDRNNWLAGEAKRNDVNILLAQSL